MALLIRSIYNNYVYYMGEYADPRTETFPMIKSPIQTVFLVTVYLLFVKDLGPKFMKDRKPINIDNIVIGYNAIQVLLCSYLSVSLLPYVYNLDWRCSPLHYTYREDEDTPHLLRLCYMYYLIKILDLADTVFFILRKKNNQATFLHVYHHTGMVIFMWFGLKYLAGGHSLYLPFVNSIVHTVMYSYYLLTAYNPAYKKSVWWKKYITQLQMLQFLFLFLAYGQTLFTPDCGYPKQLVIVMVPQNLLMLILFGDFYYKAYIKKKNN